jgi:F-type H+-transporting ATPase subunit b
LAGGGFDIKNQGYYIFDFLAYCFIVYVLAKKPMGDFLQKRRSDAESEISEATRLKAEATERLERYESKLANLETETAEIEEQFRLDGQREHDRILEEADAQADKFRSDAAMAITREGSKLRGQISAELAERSMERAEAIVLERLNATSQQALIRSFIDDLEKRTSLDSISA